MPPSDPLRLALCLVALVVLSMGVFILWPGVDLAVAGLFYVPDVGFPLAGVDWIDRLRRAIWGASIVLVLGAIPALAVASFWSVPVLRLDKRDWGFILALYTLGPGLVVEVLLKGFWGRARPAYVEQFGGTRIFTAPHEISDQCLRNCSFTSGEMAGATALAVSLALALTRWRPAIGERLWRVGMVLAVCLPVVAGTQRIAAGRHFLSDVILSALAVLLLATVLSALFRLRGKTRMAPGAAVDIPRDSPYTAPSRER